MLGRDPLNWLQVCALADYPDLIDHPSASAIFPKDAVQRAKELLTHIGSTGAYTHSKGVPFIRKSVARYIEGLLRRGESADC
jgi:alanine transaminase